MHEYNLILALLGGLVLAFALGAKGFEKSPIPFSLVALLVGMLLGPSALNVLDLSALGDRMRILEGLARLTLALGLVGVALRIPKRFPRERWRSMALLIALAMLLMWAISSLLVYWVLGLSVWLAVLIGAIVTATDPIAASPIVTGPEAREHIPERIRNTISFESGANDGLGYLFVFLPFLLMTRPTGEALSHFLIDTLFWDVCVATFVGLVIGYLAGALLMRAEARGLVLEEWRLAFAVALGLCAAGVGRLIASDEVLVIFAAAAAFVQVIDEKSRETHKKGVEAMNRFFAVPIFTVIGLAIPWAGWRELGGSGLLLAVAVLLLRRFPVLLLLAPILRPVRGMPDALFMGWFGPVAVAATYYASLMEHRLHEPLIWDVVSLVICVSVLMHGMSAVPLTRRYGRSAVKEPDESSA